MFIDRFKEAENEEKKSNCLSVNNRERSEKVQKKAHSKSSSFYSVDDGGSERAMKETKE